jgi:enamine deaminase RidA (YjgF/YER057c/UK114 family)
MEAAVPRSSNFRRSFWYGFLAALILLAALSARGQVVRIPLPHSSFLISEGIWSGNTFYLSGMLDTSVMKGTPGDTQTQTVHALQAIQGVLESQHRSIKNVVLMHAYLVGDPKHDGEMDFAGFMAGYSQFFGTKDQPSKPARSAMQVAALAAPGALVEIEVIAVKGS